MKHFKCTKLHENLRNTTPDTMECHDTYRVVYCLVIIASTYTDEHIRILSHLWALYIYHFTVYLTKL